MLGRCAATRWSAARRVVVVAGEALLPGQRGLVDRRPRSRALPRRSAARRSGAAVTQHAGRREQQSGAVDVVAQRSARGCCVESLRAARRSALGRSTRPRRRIGSAATSASRRAGAGAALRGTARAARRRTSRSTRAALVGQHAAFDAGVVVQARARRTGRCTEPAAPVFGSAAPKTTRLKRACSSAIAHIAHGSSVT